MKTEDTYNGRLQPDLLYNAYLNTSIVSVDFPTGANRVVHATGDGTKISPSFVTNDVRSCLALLLALLYFGITNTTCDRSLAMS